tara:strand:- start:141 stop:335 length:195 start_codon:yes stop_codon:yes gene_type:complete
MNNRLNWRKQKTLAMLSNKRQWEREFDPTQTTALEIQAENGFYLATETLFDANNNSLNYYIIAE